VSLVTEPSELTLSVVVPVFNQGGSIVENVGVIRQRIADELGEPFEIILVSDGSIDETEERLLEVEYHEVRVFHYARNLGKGYAVKLGALEARGQWIGLCDSDLDLDPGDLGHYVQVARERDLDFAIGSKRHPASSVSYPWSRVFASWIFQQLVRAAFRLNVRDTQVGLKVFSRDVVDQVIPLLLVKRYAFDIELLAVGRAFGFDRVQELPIHLDYKFTGSGVRSRAVLRALIDVAAIFYRLRVVRYYQRRRRFGGAFAWTRPRATLPSVTVIVTAGSRLNEPDYPGAVEVVQVEEMTTEVLRAAAQRATGEVIAVLEPGAEAPGNWLSATTPFLSRPEIAAVVVPKVAPSRGPKRMLAAAAVDESRIGAGPVYFRYIPGNLRYVRSFPSVTLVARRDAFVAAAIGVDPEAIPAAIAERAGRVLYTPEAIVAAVPPPLFRPHLERTARRGSARGRAMRHGANTPCLLAAIALASASIVVGAIFVPREAVVFGAVVVLGYVAAVSVAALGASIRFGSFFVGAMAACGVVATHVVYVVSAARRFVWSWA
jgi:glycosyltransferase involved in cell wall biosynthesis